MRWWWTFVCLTRRVASKKIRVASRWILSWKTRQTRRFDLKTAFRTGITMNPEDKGKVLICTKNILIATDIYLHVSWIASNLISIK